MWELLPAAVRDNLYMAGAIVAAVALALSFLLFMDSWKSLFKAAGLAALAGIVVGFVGAMRRRRDGASPPGPLS